MGWTPLSLVWETPESSPAHRKGGEPALGEVLGFESQQGA